MGRVHHTPYPLKHVGIDRLEESLISDIGLHATGEVCHAAFSEGVAVEIFPLALVR